MTKTACQVENEAKNDQYGFTSRALIQKLVTDDIKTFDTEYDEIKDSMYEVGAIFCSFCKQKYRSLESQLKSQRKTRHLKCPGTLEWKCSDNEKYKTLLWKYHQYKGIKRMSKRSDDEKKKIQKRTNKSKIKWKEKMELIEPGSCAKMQRIRLERNRKIGIQAASGTIISHNPVYHAVEEFFKSNVQYVLKKHEFVSRVPYVCDECVDNTGRNRSSSFRWDLRALLHNPKLDELLDDLRFACDEVAHIKYYLKRDIYKIFELIVHWMCQYLFGNLSSKYCNLIINRQNPHCHTNMKKISWIGPLQDFYSYSGKRINKKKEDYYKYDWAALLYDEDIWTSFDEIMNLIQTNTMETIYFAWTRNECGKVFILFDEYPFDMVKSIKSDLDHLGKSIKYWNCQIQCSLSIENRYIMRIDVDIDKNEIQNGCVIINVLNNICKEWNYSGFKYDQNKLVSQSWRICVKHPILTSDNKLDEFMACNYWSRWLTKYKTKLENNIKYAREEMKEKDD